MNKQTDKIGLRGMFRVQIKEDDKIVGDSGWKKNQVVNEIGRAHV